MDNDEKRRLEFGLTREEYDAAYRTHLFDGSPMWPDEIKAEQSFFEGAPQDLWLHMTRAFDLDTPIDMRWMVEHPDCDKAVAVLMFWRAMARYPFTTTDEAGHLVETEDYDVRDPASFAEMREAGVYHSGFDEHGGYKLHRVMRIVRERVAAGSYRSELRLTGSELAKHRASFEHRLESARANGWKDADQPFAVPDELSAAIDGREAKTTGIIKAPKDKVMAAYLVDHFPYGTPHIQESAKIAAAYAKKPNRSVEYYLAPMRVRAAKAAAEPDPWKWLNEKNARKKAREEAGEAAKNTPMTAVDWLLYGLLALLLLGLPVVLLRQMIT